MNASWVAGKCSGILPLRCSSAGAMTVLKLAENIVPFSVPRVEDKYRDIAISLYQQCSASSAIGFCWTKRLSSQSSVVVCVLRVGMGVRCVVCDR